MTENDKLRALLAEARESLFDLGERSASAYERGDRGSVKDAEREKAELHARIDAALSEPTIRPPEVKGGGQVSNCNCDCDYVRALNVTVIRERDEARAEAAHFKAQLREASEGRLEARAEVERLREEAGRYARAVGEVEAILGIAGDVPFSSLADEVRHAIVNACVRQRELCARNLEMAALARPRGTDWMMVIRRTPLVTEVEP